MPGLPFSSDHTESIEVSTASKIGQVEVYKTHGQPESH